MSNSSSKIFAAIDVGSYELSMKICEISKKNRVRVIDHIRHRIDLGTDTYTKGLLSGEKVDELCRVLTEFKGIMEGYQVSACQAYGTSAVREMKNRAIILEQIKGRTGISIDILSNSEQRFLDFKAVAFKGEYFNSLIESGAMIIDIGGGSIQVSLYDKSSLVTSQNIRMLGILRIRERLLRLGLSPSHYEDIINELSHGQVEVLEKLYLKGKKIETIIIVDEYISTALGKRDRDLVNHCISGEEYMQYVQALRESSFADLGRSFQLPEEGVQLLYISSMVVRNFFRVTGAEKFWIPGADLCDGIAYEYAEQNKLLGVNHDFEKDIVNCAQNISKRYMGSKKRGETLERIALTIYDSMKKVHGLGKRERLLLRLAALLHDCGRYITMANVGEASYEIVMSTEIIGLSHMEREMVASVIRFNYSDFTYYEEMEGKLPINKKSYLTVVKLTAILRMATGLDRSHREKFKDITAVCKDRQLVVSVDTAYDITLEKGLLSGRELFFKEIFNITPVIKRKRG